MRPRPKHKIEDDVPGELSTWDAKSVAAGLQFLRRGTNLLSGLDDAERGTVAAVELLLQDSAGYSQKLVLHYVAQLRALPDSSGCRYLDLTEKALFQRAAEILEQRFIQ